MRFAACMIIAALAAWAGDTRVRIETSLGAIEVEVDQNRAPATAANFLKYVEGGYYNGGAFHRTVKPGNQPKDRIRIEVIQGGINPARRADELPPLALERTSKTGLRHLDGTISMARSAPDSATSDFFICIGDQPELDFGGRRNPDGQGFAAFGRVVQGMDVVRRIQQAPAEAQALKPPVAIVRAARVGAPEAGAWQDLFDGRTLRGWHVASRPEDRQKGFWQVRDGAITCDSLGRPDHDYVWLVSDAEYGDFDLEVKVRGFAHSPGNSGVQFRSRYDEAAFWLNGPQADVHPPGPWRTGLIYDETRETRRWIFPSLPDWKIEPSQGPKQWRWKSPDEGDGWNQLRIECRGTRVKTVVNGLTIADFDGAGILDDEAHRRHNVGMKGHVALQLHSKDQLLIQYRDIRIHPR
ncbi:MAG: peptidylprolyl isomerase [Acidobacteria bacterium]|nr:peptidylprolyl isomerase [Acidobacteriota bacterium]